MPYDNAPMPRWSLWVPVAVMAGLAAVCRAATVEQASEGVYVMSNAAFERTFQAAPGQPFRTLRVGNRLTGEGLELEGEEFVLVTDAGEVTAADFVVDHVELDRGDGAATLTVGLAAPAWKARLRHELRDDQPFDTRRLTLEYIGASPAVLKRLWDGSYRAPAAGKLIKTATSASDLAAFVRQSKGGFLLNIDFPYSEIELDPERLQVRLGYPLEDAIKTGYVHQAEPVNIGAYVLDGVLVGAGGGAEVDFQRSGGSWSTNTEMRDSILNSDSPDRGEIRAFRLMYDLLAPNRRGAPQLHYQTYDDMDPRREQASIMDRPETLNRDMELAARWGFNSYAMYEDHNVFLPERPPLKTVEDVSAKARREGLLFGSGNPCNYGTGFFWKSAPTPWPRTDWAYMDADGKRNPNAAQCWAAPGFREYLLERDAPWIQKYGWTNWGLDFFIVQPCWDPAHGHPLGRASLYKQMRAAVDYHRRLRESARDPGGFVIITWLGYEPWLPKMGKWADYFYMTDPANTWPIPSVNPHEQMLAGYRRMFRRLFLEQGVSAWRLQNPIFLANWRDGLVRDAEAYPHNFISLLGFGPNVNVQQPWRFLESLTVKEFGEANAFFPKWFQYAKDNFGALSNLIVLSPSPAPGVLEVYAHPKSDGGKCILVLINTNFFRMERALALDASIGLKDTGTPWTVRERFPLERLCVIDGRTRWRSGDTVRLSVPPKTTMLFEIAPYAPVGEGEVRWYGLPEGTGRKLDYNRWRFQDEQAKTYEAAVELPPGSHVAAVRARDPEPRGAFEPVGVAYRDGCAQFRLTFPGNIIADPVQRELADWVVQPGSLEEGTAKGWPKGIQGVPTRFPLDSILNAADHDKFMTDPASLTYEGKHVGKFMGTMLCHPWCWDMPLEVEIDIAAGGPPEGSPPLDAAPAPPVAPCGPRQFPDCSQYWLSATLSQMAVQNRTMGYTPYFSERMFIPLPFVDYHGIEEIRGWVNGIPALIEKMDYVFTPPFGEHFPHGARDFLYYLDGSKNNLKTNFWDNTPNNITLWVKWKE